VYDAIKGSPDEVGKGEGLPKGESKKKGKEFRRKRDKRSGIFDKVLFVKGWYPRGEKYNDW